MTTYFLIFLRGYIDGDGCFYISKKGNLNMNITCSSDKPLLYIQKKLHLYDITSYVYKEKENKYKLMCTNKNSIIFLIDRLYYTDDLFCLKRKYEKINIYKSGSAA